MDRRFYDSPEFRQGYLSGWQQGWQDGSEPLLTGRKWLRRAWWSGVAGLGLWAMCWILLYA